MLNKIVKIDKIVVDKQQLFNGFNFTATTLVQLTLQFNLW